MARSTSSDPLRFSALRVLRSSKYASVWTLLIAATIGTPSAKASPERDSLLECECKVFLPSSETLSLSQDLAELGSRVISPSNGNLSLNLDQHRLARKRINEDPLIPNHCKNWVSDQLGFGAWRTRFQVQAQVPGPREAATASSPDLAIGERLLMGHLKGSAAWATPPCPFNSLAADPLAEALTYKSCVAANQQTIRNNVNSKFKSLSDGDLATELSNLTGFTYSESEGRIIRAFDELLGAKNFDELLGQIPTKTASLSNDEFLQLVAIFGNHMVSAYDHNRADKRKEESRGVIDTNTLFTAIKHNANTLSHSLIDPYNQVQRAGVCRDIAVFQAQLLDKRGFKDTYVVTYATQSAAHATVITRDPKDPQTLRKLNYGMIQTRAGTDGARALFQGHSAGIQDLTLQYRIYKPNGEIAGISMSETGKLLSETAGFDPKALDPLSRKESQLQFVQQHLPIPSHQVAMSVQAFSGVDGNQSQFVGAGTTVSWEGLKHFPGKIGGSVAYRKDSPSQIGAPSPAPSVPMGFIQARQSAQSKSIPVSDKASIQVGTHLDFIAGGHRHPKEAKSIAINQFLLQSELRLDAELGNQIKSNTKLSAGLSLDKKEVRDSSDAPRNLTVFPTAIGLHQKLSYQINPELLAYTEAILLANPIALRGSLELGVASPRFGASIAWSGVIPTQPDERSLLLESSLQRIKGATVIKLPGQLTLGADLQYTDIDTPDGLGELRGMTYLGGGF